MEDIDEPGGLDGVRGGLLALNDLIGGPARSTHAITSISILSDESVSQLWVFRTGALSFLTATHRRSAGLRYLDRFSRSDCIRSGRTYADQEYSPDRCSCTNTKPLLAERVDSISLLTSSINTDAISNGKFEAEEFL
ncbi:MAG: hypothetical protein JOZ66_01385 [Hyphomicrobiales bacterium]|nr:hypothetical protein [Hyphomicrobiales bacterium]